MFFGSSVPLLAVSTRSIPSFTFLGIYVHCSLGRKLRSRTDLSIALGTLLYDFPGRFPALDTPEALPVTGHSSKLTCYHRLCGSSLPEGAARGQAEYPSFCGLDQQPVGDTSIPDSSQVNGLVPTVSLSFRFSCSPCTVQRHEY